MTPKNLTAADVEKAILKWPGLYEEEGRGLCFHGMPVSEIPSQLRACGWSGVPRFDRHDLRALGLRIITARYVGGFGSKRFCDVVIVGEPR